jgi:hypothetical protein
MEVCATKNLLIPLTFFLSIADKITLNLKKNSKNTDKNSYLSYVVQLCKDSFPNIKFKDTSTQEIETIFKLLHGKKSHGYDEISMNILKFSVPFISSSPINYICSIVLLTEAFPSRLKYSEVKPLHKGGMLKYD